MLSSHNGDGARFATLDDYVLWRAEMAMAQGCDGLIDSGEICQNLQGSVWRKRPIIVLPGVRPAGHDTHEHQRSLMPFEAIQAGADYLVVGRPIRDAGNRREAAQRIQDDIASALQARADEEKPAMATRPIRGNR